MMEPKEKHLFSMIPLEEYKSKQMTSISPAGSFLESPVVAQNSYQDLKHTKISMESNKLAITSQEEKRQGYEPLNASHFSSLISEKEEDKESQSQEQGDPEEISHVISEDEMTPKNQIAPITQQEDV